MPQPPKKTQTKTRIADVPAAAHVVDAVIPVADAVLHAVDLAVARARAAGPEAAVPAAGDAVAVVHEAVPAVGAAVVPAVGAAVVPAVGPAVVPGAARIAAPTAEDATGQEIRVVAVQDRVQGAETTNVGVDRRKVARSCLRFFGCERALCHIDNAYIHRIM